jgi:hypothetical protein
MQAADWPGTYRQMGRVMPRLGKKRCRVSGARRLTTTPLTRARGGRYVAFTAFTFTLSITGCHSRAATTCTSAKPAALSFPR